MQLERQFSSVEQQFYDLCRPIVQQLGLQIYDLEFQSGKCLRIFIMDRQSGSATLDDCAKVDHALTPAFDAQDWVPAGLVLEVSSPGLDRPLKTRAHWAQAVNKEVLINLNASLEELVGDDVPANLKGGRKLKCRLVNIESESLKVEYKGHVWQIPLAGVVKAKLQDF